MTDYFDTVKQRTSELLHERLPELDDYIQSWNAFMGTNHGDTDELEAAASMIIFNQVWNTAYDLHREISQEATEHHMAKAYAYAAHRTVDLDAHTALMSIRWHLPRFSVPVKGVLHDSTR
jgi:hypothetical protein